MEDRSVLVLGAGIGGLSAAAQLAHAGYQVHVVEQRSEAGGKIMRIAQNGFTFDGGPSFITLSEIYRDWFSSLDRSIEDYLTLTKMDDTTTFHFDSDRSFTLSTDPSVVRDRIRTQFPEDLAGYDRFMKIAEDVYQALYHGPKLARRNYHKLAGFDFLFDPSFWPVIPQLRFWQSWRDLVQDCFRAPELQSIFSYQSTFLGMQPSKALGTYCFFPWAEINDGMFEVEGGVYSIAAAFQKVGEELGVTFQFDTEVTGLSIDDGRLTGVETSNGSCKADIIVSNLDGAWFYENLMPKEYNRHYTPAKLRSMRHTNSYFTINLGLSRPITETPHHTFFVAEDWQDFFEKIVTPGQVPKLSFDNTCYYLLQKSATQPWMAPKGKATAFILIPVCGYDPDLDWESYTPIFKNFLYDVIEQRDGIPIRDLIEEEIVYSPDRWGREFHLWENVILSFSLDLFQANGFRMPNRSREFPNLYFSGSSTIPGPGIPPCITSGELVRERISEEYPVPTDEPR